MARRGACLTGVRLARRPSRCLGFVSTFYGPYGCLTCWCGGLALIAQRPKLPPASFHQPLSIKLLASSQYFWLRNRTLTQADASVSDFQNAVWGQSQNSPYRALAPRAAIFASHLAACFGLSLTGPNKVSRIGPMPAIPKMPLSKPRTPCAPQKSE
jgi:hypothetical protein